ncbi:T9SS type A sorting domain-containing protein [Mariniflexile ostreae]|uniref:T9SS type A sorting domain-containing protein n=1 Tax=Mariniflexile ostreae TaxID=1520892 RepID=A0ABV5FEH4_9FLAO
MNKKNYFKGNKATLILLLIFLSSFDAIGQSIYTNDMDYVLGDVKQAFITNKITTQEDADNLLKGFTKMNVNGIRIPIFPRDITGVDLNPNKPIMDYFYTKALAQGFEIFANPAQGGGGSRIANNSLSVDASEIPVKDVQAATDELIARVLEFSNDYPNCKWINPFNEDGRATNSTWSVNQINAIYEALYNNVNGAELIGPCTWGLPAGIDMLQNTNIADYITVAASHNLGFNHGQWSSFKSLASAEGLPVWDSEVNHNDAYGTGTRLEKAIENNVDGLVLYDSWKTISLTDGSINSGAQEQMLLYLKNYSIPVSIAVSGTATQSSTNPSFNKGAELAIDGNTNGNFGGGSVTVTNPESNAWWQVDLGFEQEIGEVKIFNRTDSCCRVNMSNFTVSVINSSGTIVYSKTYAAYPNPSVTVDTGGVLGQIVKIQLNGETPLTLAEVQVFAPVTTLAVSNKEVLLIDLYPNPVSDILKIVTPISMFNHFEIYNMSGQKVLSANISNKDKTFEVNMSPFSKGIYIVKLKGNETSRVFKIVKN